MLVVSQHVMIYSWLVYQYAMQVETRFILHDTQAKEVPDFYTYYNSKVAGGTQVASAYTLVNEIVERENLKRDYNIYVFHGTDGDDWDHDGAQMPSPAQENTELCQPRGNHHRRACAGRRADGRREIHSRLRSAGGKTEAFRMDVMREDAEEPRVIEGIKTLIAEHGGPEWN